ncbi:hypothetical protein D3C76_1577890 [compost metagenome]
MEDKNKNQIIPFPFECRIELQLIEISGSLRHVQNELLRVFMQVQFSDYRVLGIHASVYLRR